MPVLPGLFVAHLRSARAHRCDFGKGILPRCRDACEDGFLILGQLHYVPFPQLACRMFGRKPVGLVIKQMKAIVWSRHRANVPSGCSLVIVFQKCRRLHCQCRAVTLVRRRRVLSGLDWQHGTSVASTAMSENAGQRRNLVPLSAVRV